MEEGKLKIEQNELKLENMGWNGIILILWEPVIKVEQYGLKVTEGGSKKKEKSLK